MRSIFELTYNPNGNNLTIAAVDNSKLYQGQVGVSEYYLKMAQPPTANDWRPSDTVFIAFNRPDGKNSQQLMSYVNGGWQLVSNGWETDVDLSFGAILNVSFIMRRYSALSPDTLVSTKTTEQVAITIHPSSAYTPLDIAGDEGEEILEALGVLNGRVEDCEQNITILDNRVPQTETEIADLTDVTNGLLKTAVYNATTGKLTFTRQDNTTFDVSLPVAITGGYVDLNTKSLVLTLASGGTITIALTGIATEGYVTTITNSIQSQVSALSSTVSSHTLSIQNLNSVTGLLLENATYNTSTGIMTFYRHNGTNFQLNLQISSIIKNAYYDDATQEIVLVFANDDEIRIPVSDLLDGLMAEDINYDNTNSGLTATTVQGAIDELVDTNINAIAVSELESTVLSIPNTGEGYINHLIVKGNTYQDANVSPTTPKSIDNCPAEFGVVSCGKNLFNLKGEINSFYNGTIVAGKNVLVDDGFRATQSFFSSHLYGQFIKVEPYKIYTISGTLSGLSDQASGGKLVVYYRNITGSYAVNVTISTLGDFLYSIIPTQDEVLIAFGWTSPAYPTTTGYAEFKNVQLALDTTPYEPYEGTTIPYRIETTDSELIQLGSLPDGTRDYVDFSVWKVVEYKKITTISDGNSSFFSNYWGNGTSDTSLFIFYIPDNWEAGTIRKADCYSNVGFSLVSTTTPNAIYSERVNGAFKINWNVLKTDIISAGFTLDTSGARAYINKIIADTGSPIVFQYPRAIPREVTVKQFNAETFPYNNKIPTYNGYTTIMTDAIPAPTLWAKEFLVSELGIDTALTYQNNTINPVTKTTLVIDPVSKITQDEINGLIVADIADAQMEIENINQDILSLSNNKQDALTAGVGIDITDNVISATTAGGGWDTVWSISKSAADTSQVIIPNGDIFLEAATFKVLFLVDSANLNITMSGEFIFDPLETDQDLPVGYCMGGAADNDIANGYLCGTEIRLYYDGDWRLELTSYAPKETVLSAPDAYPYALQRLRI